MNYFQLKIIKTARPMGNNKDWHIYSIENKEFISLKKIKEYLADEYYYVKTKYKMFNDNYNGQVGWIYAFKSDPVSYDDCKHFEQHWVNVYKIKSKPVLI